MQRYRAIVMVLLFTESNAFRAYQGTIVVIGLHSVDWPRYQTWYQCASYNERNLDLRKNISYSFTYKEL